ncbi:hypothetical protein Sp245p_22190 (plasmid) [Azospirillum baldaniorum]|uniref:Uncharacterized protein n=1 Tax=Azospirillum baldaniorum TaxID=1064539 RepID=A0A9P1NPI6_9PROT|nr:hypothetical protein Sp245p_22190 [Azospirillum baldaniorum]CCD01015.1 protein of unknown function [Azospirillum baldaniorum]
MRREPDPHYCHRFPAELIAHAVWLYGSVAKFAGNHELMVTGITTACRQTLNRAPLPNRHR